MLSDHEHGVIVDVWVVPGSSRNAVGGEHDGALRVRTTAPPVGGRANRAVARLVGEAVGGRRAEVVSGHGSRRKLILVEGVTRAAAERILAVDS